MRGRLLPPNLPFAPWLAYAWLIYLGLFLAYGVLARHQTWWWWLGHAAAVIVFLPLYFRAFWLEGRRLVPIVLGELAIGVITIPWNAGASAFFVFAAAAVGDIGRPAVAMRWLLGIVAVIAIETLLLGLRLQAWLPAILFSLIVGGGNIHFAERRRADARLRLAQNEVERLATVAERERIARDLHDLLGHTLSVIVLKSELASKLAERDPARAAIEIRDVERISRETLAEVRRAVQGYRQVSLDEALARSRLALEAAGVTLHTDIDHPPLDPRLEDAMSLAVREAATNIVRHARASRCWLRLDVEGDRLRLEVRDDGVGGRGEAGSGLSGMAARAAELGGAFEHDGRNGTTVRLTLPLRTTP